VQGRACPREEGKHR